MRILLAHNSLYYPSYGGGDKSNRLLMEALAARGHEVLVVARVENFGNTSHTRLLEELAARGVAAREENATRSEEHTSELQSPCNLVCRLLLEKKKTHSSMTE